MSAFLAAHGPFARAARPPAEFELQEVRRPPSPNAWGTDDKTVLGSGGGGGPLHGEDWLALGEGLAPPQYGARPGLAPQETLPSYRRFAQARAAVPERNEAATRGARPWKAYLGVGLGVGVVAGGLLGVFLPAVLAAQRRGGGAGTPAKEPWLGTYALYGGLTSDSCAANNLTLCSPVAGGRWRVAGAGERLTLHDLDANQTYPLRKGAGAGYTLLVPAQAGGEEGGCALEQELLAYLTFANATLAANLTATVRKEAVECVPSRGVWPRDLDSCRCDWELEGKLERGGQVAPPRLCK